MNTQTPTYPVTVTAAIGVNTHAKAVAYITNRRNELIAAAEVAVESAADFLAAGENGTARALLAQGRALLAQAARLAPR